MSLQKLIEHLKIQKGLKILEKIDSPLETKSIFFAPPQQLLALLDFQMPKSSNFGLQVPNYSAMRRKLSFTWLKNPRAYFAVSSVNSARCCALH